MKALTYFLQASVKICKQIYVKLNYYKI